MVCRAPLTIVALAVLSRASGLVPGTALRGLASRRQAAASSIEAAGEPDAKSQWRPTTDDVVRISWGKPAKQKGTGSRGVPHRLNADERRAFDAAIVSKGFLEVAGSGWRKERRDAPLLNTYRSYCDAAVTSGGFPSAPTYFFFRPPTYFPVRICSGSRPPSSQARPSIVLFKGPTGADDKVSLDFSPLRRPHLARAIMDGSIAAAAASHAAAPSEIEGVATNSALEPALATAGTPRERESGGLSAVETGDDAAAATDADDASWLSRPIYQLPRQGCGWSGLARADAKALAKALAAHLGTVPAGADGKKAKAAKGGTAERGMPRVKPGKSRRSGGFGIG